MKYTDDIDVHAALKQMIDEAPSTAHVGTFAGVRVLTSEAMPRDCAMVSDTLFRWTRGEDGRMDMRKLFHLSPPMPRQPIRITLDNPPRGGTMASLQTLKELAREGDQRARRELTRYTIANDVRPFRAHYPDCVHVYHHIRHESCGRAYWLEPVD